MSGLVSICHFTHFFGVELKQQWNLKLCDTKETETFVKKKIWKQKLIFLNYSKKTWGRMIGSFSRAGVGSGRKTWSFRFASFEFVGNP